MLPSLLDISVESCTGSVERSPKVLKTNAVITNATAPTIRTDQILVPVSIATGSKAMICSLEKKWSRPLK
jgi:hypothetical protein